MHPEAASFDFAVRQEVRAAAFLQEVQRLFAERRVTEKRWILAAAIDQDEERASDGWM
jgi:hypothetical protein